MAKTSLGKKDLQKEKQQLQLYLKLLPSIDLKRTQLMAEYTRAKKEWQEQQQIAQQTIEEVPKQLPMLANPDVQLHNLVKIDAIVLGEQSIVGTKVPALQSITFVDSTYSMLATPVWLESYKKQLKKAIEAQIRTQVMGQRVEKLSQAVRRITQHVNLFEKILIPTAKKNIQKIQIILGEAERNAVVRSKLAKALHQRQGKADFFEDMSP